RAVRRARRARRGGDAASAEKQDWRREARRRTMNDDRRDGVFVSARDLARECAGDKPPVLLDIRFRTDEHDRRFAYLAGHIPGALYVDLQQELGGTPGGTRGNRPLPEIADLQAVARRWGLSNDSRVVVY